MCGWNVSRCSGEQVAFLISGRICLSLNKWIIIQMLSYKNQLACALPYKRINPTKISQMGTRRPNWRSPLLSCGLHCCELTQFLSPHLQNGYHALPSNIPLEFKIHGCLFLKPLFHLCGPNATCSMFTYQNFHMDPACIQKGSSNASRTGEVPHPDLPKGKASYMYLDIELTTMVLAIPQLLFNFASFVAPRKSENIFLLLVTASETCWLVTWK